MGTQRVRSQILSDAEHVSSYLIDTQIFIWWVEDSPRLKPRHFDLFENAEVKLKMSMVSVWEMTTKATIGKLRFEYIDAYWEQSDRGVIDVISIGRPDMETLRTLPLHHRDPFDRMIIAQAIVRGLPLISADEVFREYDAPVVW